MQRPNVADSALLAVLGLNFLANLDNEICHIWHLVAGCKGA
jgi:hypothetical protein